MITACSCDHDISKAYSRTEKKRRQIFFYHEDFIRGEQVRTTKYNRLGDIVTEMKVQNRAFYSYDTELQVITQLFGFLPFV